MKSYQEAEVKLGNRESRKLENNTYLQRRGDNIAVKLHATDVVTYRPDGKIVLDSGGWRTVTTKDRINRYAPINLWQDKGQWYVGKNWNRPPQAIYADGMVIEPNGKLSGCKTLAQDKADQKLRAQVRKYAKDFMAALKAGKVPMPSSGDCWYCSLHEVKTGKPLGELTKGNGDSHMREHIKEKYYVPSLAVNALKAMGASRAGETTLWALMGHPEAQIWPGDFIYEQIEKSIKRYVYRELGLAY